MQKARLRNLSLLIFVACSSACSSVRVADEKIIDQGPRVTACIVDAANGGYQCADFDSDPVFVGFDKADPEGMVCMSGMDLESSLKSCKKGQTLSVPTCTINPKGEISCTPSSLPLPKSLTDLDNYFCLSHSDRSRLLQRCNPNGY